MIKTLLFCSIAIMSFPSYADLYKEMKCSSNFDLIAVGKERKKRYKKGQIHLRDNQSQVLLFSDKNKKMVLKVYPWYGVHYKAMNGFKVVEKQLEANAEFSLKAVRASSNSIISLSCKKF